MKLNFSNRIGRLVIPNKLRHDISNKFRILGHREIPHESIAMLFYFEMLMSGLCTAVLFWFLQSKSYPLVTKILISLAIFCAIVFVFWRLITIRIFYTIYLNIYGKRINAIERQLPDFLTELNTHLRSGMVFHMAIENSLNEEWGILYDLLLQVKHQIRMGQSVSQALASIPHDYKSTKIQDTFTLLAKSQREGGQTIELIDNLIENLNTSFYLKDETEASVGSYVLFISIIAIFVSPALFAISNHLLEIIRQIVDKLLAGGLAETIRLNISALSIDRNQFLIFTMIGSMISSLCTAHILTYLKEELRTIKHYVIFVSASLGVFWIVWYFLGKVFSKGMF